MSDAMREQAKPLDLRSEVDRLRNALQASIDGTKINLAEIEVLREEKARRIYYQDLVYKTCNFIDRVLGRSVSTGSGTVCGSLNEPSDGLQRGLEEVEARIQRLQNAT